MSNDKSNPPAQWELRLYTTGQSPKSVAAFTNLNRPCETYLPGQHSIEVVDLPANPNLSRDEHVVAISDWMPALPPPIRKIIDDLCDTGRMLAGLQLRPLDRALTI
jgi:circadian clock protein KaiB